MLIFDVFNLLRCHVPYTGSLLLMSQDNRLIPSLRVKLSKQTAWPLKTGSIQCPPMQLTNYQPSCTTSLKSTRAEAWNLLLLIFHTKQLFTNIICKTNQLYCTAVNIVNGTCNINKRVDFMKEMGIWQRKWHSLLKALFPGDIEFLISIFHTVNCICIQHYSDSFWTTFKPGESITL
jgi:hypothetical protein